MAGGFREFVGPLLDNIPYYKGVQVPPIKAGATPPFVPQQPQGGLLNIPYYDDVVVPQMGATGQQARPDYPGSPTPTAAPEGSLYGPPGGTVNTDLEAVDMRYLPPGGPGGVDPRVKGAGAVAAGGAGLYAANELGLGIEEQKQKVAEAQGVTVEEAEKQVTKSVIDAVEDPKEKSMLEKLSGEVDLLTVGLAMMAGNDGSRSFGELLGSAMLAGVNSKRNQEELKKRQEFREREISASELRAQASWVAANSGRSTGKPVSDSTMKAARNLLEVGMGFEFGEGKEGKLTPAEQLVVRIAGEKYDVYKGQGLSDAQIAQALRQDPDISSMIGDRSIFGGLFGTDVGVKEEAVTQAAQGTSSTSGSVLEDEITRQQAEIQQKMNEILGK